MQQTNENCERHLQTIKIQEDALYKNKNREKFVVHITEYPQNKQSCINNNLTQHCIYVHKMY